MKIKPFAAWEPNETWYNEELQHYPKVNHIQDLLESKPNTAEVTNGFNRTIDLLLNNGYYKQNDVPGIYIYEKESVSGSQLGIWVLTSLADLEQGRIVTHEQTIPSRESRIQNYRENKGIEGSPVILTYTRSMELCMLIEKVAALKPSLTFKENQNYHRIWKISDQDTLGRLQNAFAAIEEVYVADGHHRLAAAANIKSCQPQWITALYVSSGQLICKEFHRFIDLPFGISADHLFSKLNKYFCISTIPNNVAYKPTQRCRFGMQYNGVWHQLDLLPKYLAKVQDTDVQLLQRLVLAPIFNIFVPQVDRCLHYYPADRWEDLLKESKAKPKSVIFTMYPMTSDELILQAEKKINLPPKSTYVEPKVPYGLLLYQNEAAMNTIAESNA